MLNDPPSRRLVCARMMLALGVALASTAARAQDATKALSPRDLPPLAKFIPGDVGLFVEIDGLLEIGTLLREQNIWQVVENLLSRERDRTGWSEVLAASLGIESSGAMLRLFRERVALAAPDWQNLSQGVIVFTLSNPRTIQSILKEPKARRVATRGRVSLYRSHGGLWMARRGSTIVLARQRSAMFEKCAALLDKRTGKALADTPQFRACLVDLKAPRLVWAYWATASPPATASTELTGWWPALRSGAFAIRRLDDTLEITLRGAPEETEARYQPRVRLDWLGGLPQLSLAAWATSVDAREVFAAARAIDPPADLRRLWQLFTTSLDAQQFEDDVVSKIGPRCMLVFSANFRKPKLDPQFALLVESVDAGSVVSALRDFTGSVIAGMAGASETEDDEATVQLVTTEYLGVSIHELQWSRNAPDAAIDTLAELVTRNMTPAIAALDDWVVLATTTDQIHELIDARNAMTQSLDEVVPLADKDLQRAASVAIMQTALTQSMIRHWTAVLAEERKATGDQSRLGIRVHSEPVPGVVVVDAVDSNGPANGMLQPDDRIIGCDGRLLEMAGALPHLRTLINAETNAKLRVLRVLRDDEILEVAVQPVAKATPPAQGLAALVGQLAPVEDLAAAVTSVVLAVERPSPRGYRAKVTLNLARSARSKRSTPDNSEIPPE